MHPSERVAYTSTAGIFANARAAPRQQTMFVVGRIVASTREHVCMVRNISATGAGIEHAGDLATGTEVTIETRTIMPTRAIVRWSNPTTAGLEFLEPIRTLPIGAHMAYAESRNMRSPRFTLESEAQLWIGDRRVPARTIDIALGGLKLTGVDIDLPPLPARVALTNFGRTLSGRIRWNCAATVGFQFITPLSSQDLATVLHPRKPMIQ